MNLGIKVTWPAGLWMNSTADIIMNIFSELWYDVIWDNEYQSLIKWWLNWFDLFISNNKKVLSKKVDIIIAFDDKNLKNTIPSLKEGWFIIVNKKFSEKLKENIDFSKYTLLDLDIKDKYDNTYLLWILAKLLALDESLILSKIQKVFSRKWDTVVSYNQNIVSNIYKDYDLKAHFKVESIWEPKKILYWNKALTLWAIDCWLEYYSAYPMTPASTILSEVINSKKVTFLQAEDEIAVVNSALWASFTWKRAMVWTSGWGFALMTEALSFAVQAEFPIVTVLSQRAWPSTWTPTFHEVWDLNFALNPTFWDFEHIVMYPSTLEETYYYWWLALNLADKYQSVVMFLMDKQSSEMHWTVWKLDIPEIDRWKMLENPPEDYKRYKLTDDWISPRVKVGTPNWDFIATSYEHDEFWATSEDSEMKLKMTEKRFKKLENFFEREWIKWYEIYTSNIPSQPSFKSKGRGFPKKMLVVTSYTSYVAKEFVNNNPEFWLIIVKFLKPLDERLLEDIKKLDEVIFIENNYSGQLENYITKEFWLKFVDTLKISNIRKYDLYPFYIEDFEQLIK